LKKELKVPIMALSMLLFIFFFRWDYQATANYNGQVIKWKTDRWTGQKWTEQYYVNGITETPLYYSNMSKLQIQNRGVEKDLLTLAWFLSFGITSVWLLKRYWKTKRRE
jgi:hypothetical protein